MPSVPFKNPGAPCLKAGFLILLFVTPLLQAMTVINPAFSELVGNAASIVRLRVLSTECRLETAGDKQLIHTYAECERLDTLKGEQGGRITLRFLGGNAAGRTLRIPEMPVLEKDGEYVLFLSGKAQAACPILAAGNGSYQVYHDKAGGMRVRRADRHSLDSVAGLTAAAGAITPGELTLGDFEKAIRQELRSHEDNH